MSIQLNSLAIRYAEKRLFILDQRKLPHREEWIECFSIEDMAECIRTLAVRGAPLIGVAAALSLLQLAEKDCSFENLSEAAEVLKRSRPTAVNLFFAIGEVISATRTKGLAAIHETVEHLVNSEIAMSEAMGEQGKQFIQNGEGILTHCNTGGLATVGKGTALAAIIAAHESGKNIHVYVDETRPLLQGARLTTWELQKHKIPCTLICDNMAASLMRKGLIQRVFVGADRIALNGDFANKIGTYSVAIAAKAHNIPFYPVAPISTVDFHCSNDFPI